MKSLAKKVIRGIGNSRLFSLFGRLAESLPVRDQNLLRVLTYHRVANPGERPDLDPGLISATPDQFATQMNWLARDFQPVSLSDVLRSISGETNLPKRAVLVTFDDAYVDFKENAFPVLSKHSIPTALFVPTAFPDQPDRTFWWDKLYNSIVNHSDQDHLNTVFGSFPVDTLQNRMASFRRLKQLMKSLPEQEIHSSVEQIRQECGAAPSRSAVLSWSELKHLSQQGVDMVPHTHNHVLLTRVSRETAREEIRRSRQRLEQQIGACSSAFAYPSGYYDNQIVTILREEGFQLGFTTLRGVNRITRSDPFRLRRINVGSRTPDSLVRMQLIPAAGWFSRRGSEAFPENSRPRVGTAT